MPQRRTPEQRVLERIRSAFADVPSPPPEAIAHCASCKDVWLERFSSLPSSWKQVKARDIEYECEALSAVTPAAWRFLLPAYLIWHVRNSDQSSSNTVSNVIWNLTRTEKTDRYLLACYEILSNEQVRAVVDFLRMTLHSDEHGYHYASKRDGAELAASYASTSDAYEAKPGTLEHWLTERYCLYAEAPDGSLWRNEVHHHAWPLQTARASFARNTMLEFHGIRVHGPPVLLHFARRIDVVVWGSDRVAPAR